MEKVINDLVGYDGLKIVQVNEYFNFSLDSVLLANFVDINNKIKNIIDLGTGNAPIPLILSTKTKEKIIGVEIQKEVYNLAIESVKINGLENQIEILNVDIKDLLSYYKHESFDLILSNPPYFKKKDTSILNDNNIKTNARHETLINVEEIISISSKLLVNKGILALVHRTERLAEIIELLRKYNLEPKKIRFIFPKRNSESNLFLIEARKNTNSGVKVLSPLIVHDDNSNYTKEVLKMFKRGE